ncbi:MAG: hypothetical protein JXA57_08360 [Armatimonadetes bacterium]|nr:hypothetical protein [Armatimonadota bacterium]
MTLPADYVDIEGDLYPADRIGSDGKPLPITEEQARQIGQILEEEYESNPAFREAVNARAARLADTHPSTPRATMATGRRRRPSPSADAAPSGEAA